MNDESGESMELMGGVLAARVRIAAAAPSHGSARVL